MPEELKPCRWRPIQGFEGRYEVSETGFVRSLVAASGKVRPFPTLKKLVTDRDGYLRVSLYDRRKMTLMLVSRAVLLAFAGNPGGNKEASHLDGDRKNNCLSNLVWESHQENEDRKRAHGTRPHGDRNGASKIRERDIPSIRQRRAAGEKLESIAKDFGVSGSAICAICKGKTHANAA